MAQQEQQEKQPLLVVPVRRAPASEKTATRSWRGHWLQLFGFCSPEDVSSCCLAYNVPCIAFGWNLKRGLQLSFWREALRFMLLSLVTYLMMRCMGMALMMACGPPPTPMDMPMHAAAMDAAATFSGVSATTTANPGSMVMQQGASSEGFPGYGNDALIADPHGPMHMDHTWGHHGEPHVHPEDDPMSLMDPICVQMVMTSPGMVVMYALLASTVISMLYYFARRRQQLREQFGIQGSFLGDCCLWTWCSVCALAQETRTLMHNQVHDGVWYGEVPGAPHAARAGNQYMAPAAGQQMV